MVYWDIKTPVNMKQWWHKEVKKGVYIFGEVSALLYSLDICSVRNKKKI
jgi:hypothetical protein